MPFCVQRLIKCSYPYKPGSKLVTGYLFCRNPEKLSSVALINLTSNRASADILRITEEQIAGMTHYGLMIIS
jgi:hypothetical protein